MKQAKWILAVGLLLTGLHAYAWTSPVPLPDYSTASLRIVGQNARNYLSDFTASNADVKNEADFKAKTNKMANVFLALQADIVAICEVQEDDNILSFITAEMNTLANTNVYDYVLDGMRASQSSSGYMPLKAGYIYRKDKVTPEGSSTSPYSSWTYKPRMRIQTFRENATDELFVLSMNHFKAKSSSVPDDTEATRLENVDKLLTALNKVTADPDILVMGDLNAYTDEEPIQRLIEAGYEEQLVRFDPTAYTYIYKQKRGLLDHALANVSMAGQIVGAATYHINTSGLNSYRYSDHDAYVVALCLGENGCGEELGIDQVESKQRAQKTIENGQLLIILPDGSTYNVFGVRVR